MYRIKKYLLLLITLVLAPMTIQASVPKIKNAQVELLTKEMIFEISDCLAQFSSIYTVNTNNVSLFKMLAIIRSILNCVSMTYGASRLHTTLWVRQKAGTENLVDFIRLCSRGNNIFRDSTNFKKSEQILRRRHSNKQVDHNKSLSNKKFYQYVWLSANKILPIALCKLWDTNYYICYNLAELSELFRQKLMYQMILSQETD